MVLFCKLYVVTEPSAPVLERDFKMPVLYYNTLKQAVTGSIRSIAPAHAKASLLQLAPVHVPPPYPTSSYPRGPADLG